MSVPIEYRDYVTPELYTSASTPPNLSFKDYEVWMVEQTAAEERYDEAVNQHKDWKAVRVKEAQAEKLKQDKLAWQLKVKALKKEKEEAGRKVELKRQEDKQLWLEAKKAARELKKKEDAVEHQRLEDLQAKEKKEKEKEKEDEVNELVSKAAGALLASDRDSEVDLTNSKTAAMAELRMRRKIAKKKNRADAMEPRKGKFQSASMVESEEEEGASAGPSTLKCLKTEPAPQAKDKVLTGNPLWRLSSINSCKALSSDSKRE
ncbi:hypothetical protein ARMGADRAFT_1074186 [Armillaria gallica]|uniref:Uncharacterized protein n=1 Tax=Armillaria gallica TaxID=47427 RepID=A0A2H3DZJ4_ARMGA|nr:hypothetical protein ARMGADRAFT_1074186 [Armillaria gallica]